MPMRTSPGTRCAGYYASSHRRKLPRLIECYRFSHTEEESHAANRHQYLDKKVYVEACGALPRRLHAPLIDKPRQVKASLVELRVGFYRPASGGFLFLQTVV